MENVTSFSGIGNYSIEPSFIPWEISSYVEAYYKVVRDGELLRYYCAHFITVFGVISNTIAFVVLGCTRRMRKSVLGILLMTLAMADSLVLVFELVAIVTSAVLGDKQRPAPPLLCMFTNYLRYSSSSVSHLLVVCISMNRFMAVVFPFKSRWFSRPKNALLQVICVIFVCFVANIYTVSAQTKDLEICMILDQNEIAYIIGVVVFNIIICNVLTSVIVLVLSFWTARVFMQNGRKVDLRRNAEPVWNTTRAERQATILLLSVAFSFVLFRIPQLLVWTPLIMKEYNHTLLSNSTELSLLRGYFYTYTLYLLNYAVNLYLYCVCSSLFRRKLLEVFWCVTCRKSLETEPTGTNQNRTGDRSNAVQLRTELRRFESRKLKEVGSIDEVNFKLRTDVVTELKLLNNAKRNGDIKHSAIVPLRYNSH